MVSGQVWKHQNKNMKYKPLNIKNLLLGKMGNYLNRLAANKKMDGQDLRGYSLVRDITPSYTTKKNRVGIYRKTNGKKVVIKRVHYTVENLDSMYLNNETFLLEILGNMDTKIKIFPQFVDFLQSAHHLSLVTEYFESVNLENVDKKTKLEMIIKAIQLLNALSEDLKRKKFLNLPIRKPFYYLLSFPLNVTRLMIKKPKNIKKYLMLGFKFYKNYSRVIFGDFTLGLVHRDLWPDNILYSSKSNSIKIIDWESAIVSDSLYDLAQIAMIYSKELGTQNTVDLLRKYLNNNSQKRRFIGLSIFNSIQILTNNGPEHPVFKDTEKFLDTLVTDILPGILNKKSFFENVYSITLDGIGYFYKITKLPKYSKNKRIVLCYHSIGDTGWRFSVGTKNFEKHIKFLKKNYKFISLDEVLAGKKSGIHIAFDDGYTDVIENALPLLEKINVKATMFALSDYKNANRTELDNNLPIINYNQLKYLHNKGWEIGSHTRTHSHLGKMQNFALEDEIVKSKKELEKNLGFSVKYLAYPKGTYSKKIIEYVKKAGYQNAFTVDGYDISAGDKDPMKLSRISIEGEVETEQLEALLSPLGLITSRLFMNMLKLKESFINSI